jgi:hypothetical protein
VRLPFAPSEMLVPPQCVTATFPPVNNRVEGAIMALEVPESHDRPSQHSHALD